MDEHEAEWIVTEAWRENREKNKRLIADAITCLILSLCSTVSGYGLLLAPGMNQKTMMRFEEYHLYVVAALWLCFNIFLFLELLVIGVKRLRKLWNE